MDTPPWMEDVTPHSGVRHAQAPPARPASPLPLLSFRVAWRFASPLALVVDGEALAAPQGRAEDVLVALELRDGVAARAGYRIIEGGADNATVYNFALVHHLGPGITVRL
jgi:hypothetical protein